LRKQLNDGIRSAAPTPIGVEYDLRVQDVLVIALEQTLQNISTLLLIDQDGIIVLCAHGSKNFLEQCADGAGHAGMNLWILPQNCGEQG
jgi:hypothetical protein